LGLWMKKFASICLANNEIFYTRNKDHFEKIEQLSITNWYEMGKKLKMK